MSAPFSRIDVPEGAKPEQLLAVGVDVAGRLDHLESVREELLSLPLDATTRARVDAGYAGVRVAFNELLAALTSEAE